jgi:hypothetical protein
VILGLVASSTLVVDAFFLKSFRINNLNKRKTVLTETNAALNRAYSDSENKSQIGNITFIARLSELPSQRNIALQEHTKAAAEVKTECSFDVSISV